MKAAVFEYVRTDTLEHALAQLAQLGGDAKLIAGGQSLVPMMAMRLARPAWLLDIDRVVSLKECDFQSGFVRIGAGTRQNTAEHNTQFGQALPLLRKALRWVGHEQTRNRGTVGGSVVHADPSAEIPLVCLILNASFNLQSQTNGVRQLTSGDFFLGPMFTAIGEDECLTSIELPIWHGPYQGSAFEETSIRAGDFAMASAACQLQTDADGKLTRLCMGLGGVDGTPLAFADLSTQLLGEKLTAERAKEVAVEAAANCNPGSDMHAQAPYRKHLATKLLERVLIDAAKEAEKALPGA